MFDVIRPLLSVPGNVFLGGDFNCVLHAGDRSGRKGKADPSARILKSVLQSCDLMDAALKKEWNVARFTRWRGQSQARLDRLYVPGDLLAQVVSYEVTPVSFSDHGLVTCEVQLGHTLAVPKSRKRWIMNATVLKNTSFVEKMTKEIENLKLGAVDTAAWEQFKKNVKHVAIDIGRRQAAEGRARERDLLETLRSLIEAEEEQPGEFHKDIKYVKQELRNELERRYWGALVRSRESQVEHEAQPSKLFRAFERERVAQNIIIEVEHNGVLAFGSGEVASAFSEYFSRLFSDDQAPELVP